MPFALVRWCVRALPPPPCPLGHLFSAGGPTAADDMDVGGGVDVRAVQSPPFPPCAAKRCGGPGGGRGTPGLAPGPHPPRPHVEPTLLPNPRPYILANRRVNTGISARG
jgi:hypothetical protein